MPNVHNMSLTATIDVLFSVNFAVVFDFIYFRFRPSKAKWIGNGLPNRQKAAIRSMVFFSSLYRALPIDAANHPASLGDARRTEKKIREIKFGNYRRCKFGPHYLLAQQALLRQYIGAAQVYPYLILQQISWALFAAFCLFGRAGIFKKSMGARHRGGIGFSYRPVRLHRPAEFIPWNQCRGPINI